MSGPFQPDRVPEPRWIHGDPQAFADEPPDNYLPDEQRKALSELVEFLDGDLYEVEQQYQGGANDVDSRLRKAADEAYGEWRKATEKFRNEVEGLWDETVGDDWNEPEW